MNRSEIFKAAHKLAKTFVGSYVACFAMALKTVYQNIKGVAKIIKRRFVKMHQFMVIEIATGIFERYEVADTRAATHDWIPSKLIESKTLDANGIAMFEQLWTKQNQPMIEVS